MSYIITTDSCSDLTKEYADKRDLKVISLLFTIKDQEYMDDLGESMKPEHFFKTVRDGAMPTTSLINAQRFLDFFEPMLKNGDDVLHLQHP